MNVRDLDVSHRFWAECLGFRQVGVFERPGADGKAPVRMRFYSGELDGKLGHHDIALLERPALAADQAEMPQALNHVAVGYPSREAWQAQIEFLTARGVALHRQVDRGATSSIHLTDPDGNEIELVYEKPRALWEGDIQAALNTAVVQPIHG
jgi:catechol 2,3-dioxygenase